MQDLPENLQKAIGKSRNKNMDPVSEAALEVVTLDQNREQSALAEQEDREQRVAESYEIAGRIQALTFVGKVLTVGTLMQLANIKKSKAYRDLPNIGTWDNYCEYLGFSRQKVDLDLSNLAAFGEEFLLTVSGFSLGYRELRKLRRLNSEGILQVKDNEVMIGDERIPLTPDSKEELEIALERLIEAKDEVIREKEATLRANQKIIDSKQDLIRRQEKDLAKYEKEAEANGLSDPEKVFIQKVQNARITIEGFLNQFDPQYNPLPEDATPKMKAELMLTLQSFVRSTRASYDTAAELYGDAELDGGGWIPPHLRTEDGDE